MFFSFLSRWYKHNSSYKDEMSSLPGVCKSLEELGFGAEPSEKNEPMVNGAAGDDDDDFDFFGSDEEEDAEAERIKGR